MAEAVFKHLLDEADLSQEIMVDSAGTGSWHVGEQAHVGTRRILADHAISYDGRARQVKPADMSDPATYIIAMDQNNLNDLRRRYGERSRLFRLLDFAPEFDVRDVPDPYYGGDFEYVYQLVEAGCRGLLDEIIEREHLGASK